MPLFFLYNYIGHCCKCILFIYCFFMSFNSLVGVAIATPASQLWSPLKFEQNTNYFFSNGMSREKIPIKPGFVLFNKINFLAFLVFFKKWYDFWQKFQILENLNIFGHRNCDAGVAIAIPENASGHCNFGADRTVI